MTTQAYRQGYESGLAYGRGQSDRAADWVAAKRTFRGRDFGLWRRGQTRGFRHGIRDKMGVPRNAELPYDMVVLT